MIIIVEGPDNSGKTTLALRLAELLKAVYVKSFTRPERSIDVLSYHRVLEMAEFYSHFIISDRHPIVSDPIYSLIVRKQHSCVTLLDIEELEARTDAFVHCRPPTPTLMATLSDRPQMEGVFDHASEIIQAYDEYFQAVHTDQRVLLQVFDYTQNRVEVLADYLQKYAQEYKL